MTWIGRSTNIHYFMMILGILLMLYLASIPQGAIGGIYFRNVKHIGCVLILVNPVYTKTYFGFIQTLYLYSGQRCYTDIGFMLDASQSVWMNWEQQKEFVYLMAKAINTSPKGGHVSVMKFNDRSSLIYKFSDPQHFSTLYSKLNAEQRLWESRYAGTNIDLALNTSLYEMFQVTNGMRPKSPKTLVFISDAVQTSPWPPSYPNYPAWKKMFMEAGIRVIAIGIDTKVQKLNKDQINHLLSLVNSTEDMYHLENYNILLNDAFIESITRCEGKI